METQILTINFQITSFKGISSHEEKVEVPGSTDIGIITNILARMSRLDEAASGRYFPLVKTATKSKESDTLFVFISAFDLPEDEIDDLITTITKYVREYSNVYFTSEGWEHYKKAYPERLISEYSSAFIDVVDDDGVQLRSYSRIMFYPINNDLENDPVVKEWFLDGASFNYRVNKYLSKYNINDAKINLTTSIVTNAFGQKNFMVKMDKYTFNTYLRNIDDAVNKVLSDMEREFFSNYMKETIATK